MAQAKNKTQAHDGSVETFLSSVEPGWKQDEARQLDQLFQTVTGWRPRMWGPSMIGYGEYHFKYDSGREGDFFATGFSPRKAQHSIYIMPGYSNYDAILERIGKYKLGKSCFYVKKLEQIDLDVLKELIRAGLDDLAKKYPVKGT